MKSQNSEKRGRKPLPFDQLAEPTKRLYTGRFKLKFPNEGSRGWEVRDLPNNDPAYMSLLYNYIRCTGLRPYLEPFVSQMASERNDDVWSDEVPEPTPCLIPLPEPPPTPTPAVWEADPIPTPVCM